MPQVVITTLCHQAQATNNSKIERAGDNTDETLHLRILSVAVILLVVVGILVTAIVTVRSLIQRKTRRKGSHRRDGSDMTGNPMYNTSTAISANPFLLSPLLSNSQFSNNACYENPDRLYENPDRYGEVNRGIVNTCGMPTLLNSAYGSSEDGLSSLVFGNEKQNDYTIATPLNPAYSSLQRQQSQNNPLAQLQEEPKATNSSLDFGDANVQSSISALIVPMKEEIMKTPSQLFEILHEESDTTDTDITTVNQENEKEEEKEMKREDPQHKELDERYCIFFPEKDL